MKHCQTSDGDERLNLMFYGENDDLLSGYPCLTRLIVKMCISKFHLRNDHRIFPVALQDLPHHFNWFSLTCIDVNSCLASSQSMLPQVDAS